METLAILIVFGPTIAMVFYSCFEADQPETEREKWKRS